MSIIYSVNYAGTGGWGLGASKNQPPVTSPQPPIASPRLSDLHRFERETLLRAGDTATGAADAVVLVDDFHDHTRRIGFLVDQVAPQTLEEAVHPDDVTCLPGAGGVEGPDVVVAGDARPVAQQVSRVLPYTLELTFCAILLGYVLGVPLGISAAVHRNSFIDYFNRIFFQNSVIIFYLLDKSGFHKSTIVCNGIVKSKDLQRG